MALENLQLINSFIGKIPVQPLLELLIKETSIPEMKCHQKNEEKKTDEKDGNRWPQPLTLCQEFILPLKTFGLIFWLRFYEGFHNPSVKHLLVNPLL